MAETTLPDGGPLPCQPDQTAGHDCQTLSEALSAVGSFDGLTLLLGTVFVAGLVRGFTGFGTALVYAPLASTVLPPVWVMVSLITFDVLGPLPMMPRAMRDGDLRDVLWLMPGAVVGLALGLLLLTRLDPVIFRWMICVIALSLLAALASGWRYRRALGRAAKTIVGALAGLFGGAAGVGGPPVILFYMGGVRPPAAIRANITMFLVLFGMLYLALLAANGLLARFPVMVGLSLVVPYALGGLMGQAIFDPRRERLYRGISYLVIAAAALAGMPVFD